MSDKLLPCPFCGGEAETIRNDIGVFIGCFNDDCPIGPATSTYIDGYATEAEAVAAWNARVDRTCETCPQMDNPDSFIRHLMGRETYELEELARDMYKAIVMMIAIPSYADTHTSELEAIDDRARGLGVVKP